MGVLDDELSDQMEVAIVRHLRRDATPAEIAQVCAAIAQEYYSEMHHALDEMHAKLAEMRAMAHKAADVVLDARIERRRSDEDNG